MSAQRPSPAVYRRRRLTVLLIAVVVLALVIWGITAAIGALNSKPEVSATPEPTTSAIPTTTLTPTPTPTQAPTPTPTGPTKCTAAQISVTAQIDAEHFGAGVHPKFSMTIKNTSQNACVINVGTNAQEYVVTSGSDRIWSSKDCLQNGADQEVQFDAGKEVTAPAIEWVRQRSAPDTCNASNRPEAANGYYQLTVTVDGITSEATTFVLD